MVQNLIKLYTAWLVLSAINARLIVPEISPEKSIQYISAPFRRSSSPSLKKRGLASTLSNHVINYTIDLKIGSNNQSQTLEIDTGSSDLWVVGLDSCSACTGGIFNPSQSTTDTEPNYMGDFKIAYIDGTKVSGIYFKDDISIGGAKVENVTFGVINSTFGGTQGIMGLGTCFDEAGAAKYSTILDVMKKQGLIISAAFSLNLNATAAYSGSIIFGGYDSSGFTGDLVSLPMSTAYGSTPSPNIEWTGLWLSDPNGTSASVTLQRSKPALLDTGYSLSSVPDDIFDVFHEFFNLTRSGSSWYVPCSQPDGKLDIVFGSTDGPQITIAVPFVDLALPQDLSFNGIGTGEMCQFGFQPSSAWGSKDASASFGDTVLRNAYVVINYDRHTISLAQAQHNYRCATENCIVTV